MILRAINYIVLATLFFIFSATLMPASYWYQVNTVKVGDAEYGIPAPITADREVRRDFMGSYQVIVRTTESTEAVCDARSEPFTYYERKELLKKDMEWWAPSDARCSNLPPGEYIMETTWTLQGLLWGLIPNKHVKAYSNPFTVHSAE